MIWLWLSILLYIEWTVEIQTPPPSEFLFKEEFTTNSSGKGKSKNVLLNTTKSLHATCVEIENLSGLEYRSYVDPTATGTRIGAKADFTAEDVQNAKEKLRK